MSDLNGESVTNVGVINFTDRKWLGILEESLALLIVSMIFG
jgi:hypothetical protein